MKKRILVFLLAFAIILILGLFFKNFISASIFDTYATIEQATTLNITIDAFPPDLIVDSPVSTNYTTENVDIKYSVSDSGSGVDTVWYNLDGGQNNTLTENTTITASKGDNNLYIYANDSAGLVNDTEFVIFSVNATRTIEVNFSRFGFPTTTNFSDLDDTNLEDIENLTLEISSFGKIRFSENINISENTDLDTYGDISDNNIYINSDVLPNFNKPATLWLYGLNFNNPRVLKDGSVCSDSICTEVDYSGGVLEFTVTGFTNYSAEETPTEEPGPTGGVTGGGGGGGGGGGRVSSQVLSFDVDKSLIKVSLKQGETKRESLTIKNTGPDDLDISLDLKNLEEFVIFPGGVSTYNLKLKYGEEQTIQLIFNVAKDKEPGVYPGRIIVKSDSLQKTITTIVEVELEKPLFDIDVEILPNYKLISPCEIVSSEIRIFNLFGKGKVDVRVGYGVKDLDGNVIASGSNIVAVETQMSFVRTLTLPCDTKPGIYVFYTESEYEGEISTSSDTFEVLKHPRDIIGYITNIQTITIILISIINLFIILVLRDIIIKYRKRKDEEAPLEPEKEKELKEKKPQKVLEEPKKVEEVKKKKGKPSDLVENIRKIRERMR